MISPNADSSMISLEALPKQLRPFDLDLIFASENHFEGRGEELHGFEHHNGELDKYIGIPLRFLLFWENTKYGKYICMKVGDLMIKLLISFSSNAYYGPLQPNN